MDDCNSCFSPDPDQADTSSDSSMDDCNAIAALIAIGVLVVQIPLWTIVTMTAAITLPIIAVFRFLYGRL